MNRIGMYVCAALLLGGLAGCGRPSTASAPPERIVFRVSPDGDWLEGRAAGREEAPLGRIRLPENAVWSVADSGEDLRVWVHSDAGVMLVDARRWAVLGEWPREAATDAPPSLLAQRVTMPQ
ncbi:MAG: hypothetical protein KDE68_02425 [Rhodocyclaceae bacterium]|nr:hypothetical protein [Rhodocyclaceae bacterium]